MAEKHDRKLRERDIDAHLKRAFQAVSEEGIPDRFASLLQRLEAGEGVPQEANAGEEDASPEKRPASVGASGGGSAE